MKNINSLAPNRWVLVDQDTGTVLGTNVVLVPADRIPDSDLSDSEIMALASEHGSELFTPDPSDH